MISSERREEIDRRINERYLIGEGQQTAYHNDALYHLNVKLLRQMLAATEEAMAAEGIDEAARDRIAYRLLYGDLPQSYASPDFRGARNRMIDREKAMLRLAGQPLLGGPPAQ